MLHLLGEGHRVVVPYRDEEGWRALRPETHAGALWGRKVHLVDFEDTRSFVDEAARILGSIDGVAALAGAFAMSGTLEAAPASEWGTMMDTNLTTVYNVCRAALPHLLKGGGSVVTVSSRSAENRRRGCGGLRGVEGGRLSPDACPRPRESRPRGSSQLHRAGAHRHAPESRGHAQGRHVEMDESEANRRRHCVPALRRVSANDRRAHPGGRPRLEPGLRVLFGLVAVELTDQVQERQNEEDQCREQ